MLMKGLRMVEATGVVVAWDSWMTGAAAALVVLGLTFSRRVPAALVLFLAGLAVAMVTRPDAADSLRIGLSFPSWSPPVWDDFVQSFPRAALPQIPLSLIHI